ncbi:MAG: DegT/DnrJ/EryC1/StrS family aminotransferase, partial [Candidatus Marsarchaeota archaeon]|nr:DegT/DnrJ/EryC1/StrS family aminotransferase [Candidatus Marsarchaeota archaeon]
GLRILSGPSARNWHLEEAGIQSKVYFEPAHKTHFYKQVLRYHDSLPCSEEMTGLVLSLPVFVGLDESETAMVAKEAGAYMKKRA